MAFTKTTLASAMALTDTMINVAAATNFNANQYVKIDEEFMKVVSSYPGTATSIGVLRAQNGTVAMAHVITASVITAPISSTAISDWADPAASVVTSYPLAARRRKVQSYTTAGAIAIPQAGTDFVAVLNSTNALAMTLAVPTTDMDGVILTVIGNGKAAHTLTVAGGFGLGSTGYTIGTFDTNAQCAIQVMACGAAWVPLPSPFSGTLTGIDVAIS